MAGQERHNVKVAPRLAHFPPTHGGAHCQRQAQPERQATEGGGRHSTTTQSVASRHSEGTTPMSSVGARKNM